MTRAVVVASGTGFGEGPVWRPDHGDLITTSVSDGWLWRIDIERGAAERFADTAGGPNGALVLDDGGILVAQNGGLDVSRWWKHSPPPVRPVPAGLQIVSPTGEVRAVATEHSLRAPNDLAVDDDGTVVFTDVIASSDFSTMTGRLWRLFDHGAIELLEEIPHYLNGVSAAPGGLLTAEANGLRWLRSGDPSWYSPDCGRIDGFAVDLDGRAYTCQPGEGAVVVVDVDGSVVDRLALTDGSFPTNCCFGGPDLRTLFVTDAGNATVVAFESMPTSGFSLRAFRFAPSA